MQKDDSRRQGHEALRVASSSIFPRDFLIEEWKVTREQVHIVLQAIWRFEATTILALAGFYAWFFNAHAVTPGATSVLDNLTAVLLAFVPVAMSFAILGRLKIEYSILIRLGSYTKQIEDYLFRGCVMPVVGWQTFLAHQSPDEVEWREFRTKYSNAFRVFVGLFGSTLLALALSIYKARRELQDLAERLWSVTGL